MKKACWIQIKPCYAISKGESIIKFAEQGLLQIIFTQSFAPIKSTAAIIPDSGETMVKKEELFYWWNIVGKSTSPALEQI